ncbi:urease accessory protein UreF [Microtetraspora niveoalba]|uniref:urease accessory protein UreF n=1 Tax=Microtetraspora niveoalba TaxID=46175 RepID=UPI000A753D04|nr:urease accessory UreF family protein [Microtetraspora niveoalba]
MRGTDGSGPGGGRGWPDPGPLLAQLQLTDSAFPSGRYTLSYGLEGFTQEGPVDVAEFLADVLRHSAGPGDGRALVLAHRAVAARDWDALVAADRRLHAVKLNREMRAASARTGRQVLDTACLVFGGAVPERLAALVRAGATPGNHAVVVGALHAASGVSAENAVVCDLYSFASAVAGAAVRLGRIDFRRAQAVLYGARDGIGRAALVALAARHPRDVHSCAPAADAASAAHERAQARLFIT